jgi:uncharacterized membrane protein
MELAASVISVNMLWAAYAVFAVVFFRALLTAPWFRFRVSERLHVLLGACVCIMVLWTIRVEISPGLTYHLLGVTALLLMFGWQLSLLAVTVVVAGSALYGNGDWSSAALNVLILGAVPIAVTHYLLLWSRARLPANPFVFFFINAFFGAAISLLTVAAVTGLILVWSENYGLEEFSAYLVYLPLFCFPEAIINGMVITAVSVFRPRWVLGYEEERYPR